MDFAHLIEIPKIDSVILHRQLKKPIYGTLCLTFSHIIVSERNKSESDDEKGNSEELWLLHQSIDSIEKKPYLVNSQLMNVPGKGHNIILKLKDLRIVTLEIPQAQDYLAVSASIEQLSSLKDPKTLYAFYYRPIYHLYLENGFNIFRPEIEFSKLIASDEWRISTVNESYDVCQSYSSKLIVPKCITDEQLIQSSQFRDLGRFPIISYRHENGAVLMKSSQPNPNSTKRCKADEALLNCLLNKNQKGFIIDTTGGKNKWTGENEQHYSLWKKFIRPIGNFAHPSGFLDCFSKLIEACNDTGSSTEKWLSRLESSGWLTLVLNSLNTACIVAQCMAQEGSSVLVHGGQGMDSTLIVTSLVQIILNPDSRTVRGLQALIDREWIQAGHPFGTRHAQSCYSSSQQRAKSSGASFVLFLDCVYQLYQQFPLSFEFDPHILIILFEHSYFSQYGTFIVDNEMERVELMAFTKTTSLWSHLNRPDIITNLLNSAYEPNQSIIWPSVAPVSLVLWSDLYLRFVVENNQIKKIKQHVESMISSEKELRSRVLRLRKQLSDLKKEYDELQVDQKIYNNDNSNNPLFNGAN
ncbi:hypothetical protein PVAND_017185 [Polypedilum vanderplanki]|uniref:Myotubularin phosphatase domain-containing protein n=1 Tax=Polypedilum vanderplanki TaxID=319348 RepID=A0A9J6BI00_POLVA|nr:hypothetical protein PVAND_017185 [Polypedilum vanderplanki]KAG5669297.1 hypothetical protein PVAND_017185 [Polypedilum vanderplanki]